MRRRWFLTRVTGGTEWALPLIGRHSSMFTISWNNPRNVTKYRMSLEEAALLALFLRADGQDLLELALRE